MPDKVQNDKAVAKAAYIADKFHDAVIGEVVNHTDRQGHVASRQRIAYSVCLNYPNGEAECAGQSQFHSHRLNSQLALNLKQQLTVTTADIENLTKRLRISR